jgi:hypothetical protein
MLNKFSMCIFVCIFSLLVFAQQKAPVQISKENAEILKKNEALKPPLLPQEPIVAKEKSDAEDEGLKGKVKQVVDEREEQSGGAREISHVMYFNERGNFLERDYYSQGNLYLITTYGYIDGKRVAKGKYIESENDAALRVAPLKPKNEEPLKKADTRFDYSLEYKYVNGKLAQTQMISNRDEAGMRYVYNHTNNQIEKLVYTKEGDLNQKYLVILDKEGNITEEIFFGLKNVDIYGDSKHRYTYEFDKRGNWIKKTASIELTKNGITSSSPGYVKHRTIIYY